MHKIFKRLMLTAALLTVPWVLQAQTHYTVAVGSGTDSSGYVPSYSWEYNFSQTIVRANEIGVDGVIVTIAFQVGSRNATRQLAIYMAELSKGSYSGGSDVVGGSHFQQVFSGTVTFSPGWVAIPLNNTFTYHDTADLIITVLDATGTYNSVYPYYRGTNSTDGYRSLYDYDMYDPYSLSSLPTDGTPSTFVPNIRLGISSYSAYCVPPTDVAVGNIVGSDATIAWTENGTATSWELVISDTMVTDFSDLTPISSSSDSYTVSGLSENTLYYVYVRAVCDASSNSNWTYPVTFHSACTSYMAVPYATGFEGLATGELPNCWLQLARGNSSAGSFPTVYSYSSNARTGDAYLEFESSSAQTELLALPSMDNISSLQLSFYASVMNSNFVFEVGVMEDTLFVPVDTVALTTGSGNHWQRWYNQYTVYFNQYFGIGDRIALRVTPTGNSYTLMIDDLAVEEIPNCLPPNDFRLVHIASDQATLSWREIGYASSWELLYDTITFDPDTTYLTSLEAYDTIITLTDLTLGTEYTAYVRSNCGDYSPWVGPLSFVAGQYVMPMLGSDTLQTCGITIYDDGGANGSYSTYTDFTLVIYPLSEDSVVTFWGNTDFYYDYARLRIYDGVGTNGTVLWQSDSYAETIPSARSTVGPITVQFTGGSYQSGYDGFELHTACEAAPACAYISNLNADNVGTGSVHLLWNITGTNFGMPIQYEVEAVEVATGLVVTNTTVTSTNATLYGLTASTDYKVRVHADCDYGDYGAWDSLYITTTNLPCLAYDTAINDTLTLAGSSTSTTYYIPVNNYYNYSYTQQIIDQEEFNGATIISGIDFEYAGGSASTAKDSCIIYLANTTATTLNSSFVPYDSIAFVAVYSGSLNCSTGWNHFEFSTPFAYDGRSNLLVTVLDNSGGYNGTAYTFNTHPAIGKSRYICNDSYPYDIANVGSGSTLSYRANMRLHVAGCSQYAECARPSVVVDSIGSDIVALSWAPGYQETSWLVEYKAESDTDWTYEGVFSSMSHTFPLLTPNNLYSFRITSLCTDTNLATVVNVRTLCMIDTVPFASSFEDFSTSDNQAPSCWYMNSNMTYGSYPYATNSYAHTGSLSLYAYSTSGCYSYVVLPVLAPAIDSLEVSFWLFNAYSYTTCEVNVGVMTNPEDISTFVSQGTISLTDINTWVPVHVKLNNYHGNGRYIAIVSPSSVSSNPYIDDILVDYIRPCPRVENVTLVDVSQNTATLAWSGSEGAAYEVEYGPAGFAHGTGIVVSSLLDTITLTGLTHNTAYDFYVRTFCEDGDTSSWSSSLIFRTSCLLLDTLPFAEDFESLPTGWGSSNSADFVPCWTRYFDASTSSNYPYVSSYNAYDGSHCLYWYWYNTYANQYIALPSIDTLSLPINTLQLSFYARSSATYYTPILLVGVMDGADNLASFQAVDTILLTSDEYSHFEIPLNSYHGSGNTIAIKPGNSTATSYWYAYLDGFLLDTIPSCPHVENLAMLTNGSTSVTIGWTEAGSASMWEVAVDTSVTATPVADSLVYDSPNITLNGLVSGAYYFVWVRAICGEGDTSAWEGPILAVPNSWTMRPNQTDTVYMCGGVIFDDGGPLANYTASQNSSVVVIMPNESNTILSVSGSSYTESTYDYLNIYDGIGTDGTLLWTDNGTTALTSFGPFTSTEGPVTLEFKSDGSVFYDGFEVHVECLSTHCRVSHVRLNASLPERANSLAIVWDNNGATSYQLEYGAAGFAQGTGTLLTRSTNDAIITGLAPMSSYDVYVRSICGVGDTGAWVRYTFQTALCDNMTIVDAYDTDTAATYSSCTPLGYSSYEYTYVQSIIDSAYLADLTGDITAFAFLPTTSNGGSYYTNVTLYLANVSESDLSAGFIVPDSNHQFVKVLDSADLCYSTNTWQLHPFDTAFTWDGHSNILLVVKRDDGDYSYGARFSAHSTADVKCRYTYDYDYPVDLNNPGNGNTHNYAPDIQFYSCNTPSCPQPEITSVAQTYESVTISWTGSGNAYEVNIKERMAVSWPADIAVPGSSYTFMGLQPATEYTVRVRQDCTTDSLGYSEWFTATVVTDSLQCFTPDSFTVTNITNDSATFDWQPRGNETMWEVRVWNTAGFDNTYSVSSHPVELGGFIAGVTYNAAVRPLCGSANQFDGEWSATVTFTTATCPDVTALQATEVQAHSLTLSWTANPAAQSWVVEYGFTGFEQGSGTQDVTTTPSYVVTGLMGETGYDFYVRAMCGANWYSENWAYVTATTAYGEEECDPVTNLTVSDITETSAMVSWTAGATGTEWEVTLTDSRGSTLSEARTQEQRYQLNDLTPGTSQAYLTALGAARAAMEGHG